MKRAGAAEGEAARVLYLVYWGAAEPLGRALVVPSVLALAGRGARVTLVTFERPSDLRSVDALRQVRAQLEAGGVRFLPRRYHKRPKWPATAFDILQGVASALRARGAGPIDVVHARTFVGGVMGFFAARLLGARLVYHNEGFYPDEQVDGGVWRAGSLAHRVAKAIERGLYARADGIAVLSQRAKRQIEALPAVARKGTPVIVVPSAVDLERFRARPPLTPGERASLRFLYVGSVGLRYRLDRVSRFVKIASARTNASLRVLTGAPPELVESLLSKGGLPRSSWSSAWAPPETVPGELAAGHVGLFFLTQGLSEHACSPTKFGEYWAAGLPVVTTPNVSDSEEIIRSERVGVVVREHSDEAYGRAFEELLELLCDPDLPQRCRRAAETHYDLRRACAEQMAVYRRLSRTG